MSNFEIKDDKIVISDPLLGEILTLPLQEDPFLFDEQERLCSILKEFHDCVGTPAFVAKLIPALEKLNLDL